MAPRRTTRKKATELVVQAIQCRLNRAAKQKASKRSKNSGSSGRQNKKRKTTTKIEREQFLEKKRVAERLRIEKIKQNPETHAVYLEAQRKRYQKRKKEGQIKPMKQLDPRS